MSNFTSNDTQERTNFGVRKYGVLLYSKTGKIEIKAGNYHCSKSWFIDLCVPCEMRFCGDCQLWKTFADYIGKHKRKGNTCADCRDIKYSQKRIGSLSVRTRFQVFRRDKFTCQYCGRSAPNVILHADHIHPLSKGGDNSLENLITSCQDCNLGKSDSV